MKYDLKAIIFDLDGTLLYTLSDIADAMNAALAELKLPPNAEESYRWIVGGGAENIATKVLPVSMHSDAQIKAFVERFRFYYLQNWHNKSVIYEGIPALIDYLRLHGYLLAILSNKPQEFALNIVDYYFHSKETVFQPVMGQRKGIPTKPDPGSALEIARHWNLKPDVIGLMGDSDVDIITAKNAGMVSIGADWGFRGRDELQAQGADILLDHPLDLIPYLVI